MIQALKSEFWSIKQKCSPAISGAAQTGINMKLYEYYLLKRGTKDLLAVYWWRKKAIARMVQKKYFCYWGIISKGRCKGLMAAAEMPAGAEAMPTLKNEIKERAKFWSELLAAVTGALAALASLLALIF